MNKIQTCLTLVMLCTLAQAELRTWTLKNGKTKDAEYKTIMSGNVILKSKRGRQIKIPLDQLSKTDLTFLELANPPKFKLQVLKNENRVQYKPVPNDALPPQNRKRKYPALSARIKDRNIFHSR